jgi:hypothetical protein
MSSGTAARRITNDNANLERQMNRAHYDSVTASGETAHRAPQSIKLDQDNSRILMGDRQIAPLSIRSPRRPIDYQRARVYKWERAEIFSRDDENIGLTACQALIEQVFRAAELPTPTVGDGRGRRMACFSPDEYAIKLPCWARTRPVVMHEAAHGLARHGNGVLSFGQVSVHVGRGRPSNAELRHDRRSRWSVHGPIFMAIFIGLLADLRIGTATTLRSSAIDFGVDVEPFN